ncbi:hypothetical protein LguiA_005146 [Lonicera macranthoides]
MQGTDRQISISIPSGQLSRHIMGLVSLYHHHILTFQSQPVMVSIHKSGPTTGSLTKQSTHKELFVPILQFLWHEDIRIPFERFGSIKDVYLPKNYYTCISLPGRRRLK